MKMQIVQCCRYTAILMSLFSLIQAKAQDNKPPRIPTVPMMLKKDQRIAGNPLATYAAMLDSEQMYMNSVFKEIYPEQKKNMEEFLGFPRAGMEAMQLKNLRQNYANDSEKLPAGYHPVSALKVISQQAEKHRIIIWGEEHHLPQSRALYPAILQELWKKGFRYLAAETFSEEIESEKSSYATYNDGYYIQDPVFADAVRTARKLGFKLIAYDNKEKERDKKQAELIKEKIFDKDPSAKVFIIAGRGHISEKVSSDGWEPMGYCLEKITGLDAFTIYAPTMSERLAPEEEHPVYRDVVQRGLVKEICIFVKGKTGSCFGTESMDAYAFFPPLKYIDGRPDWLFSVPGRKPVKVPVELIKETRPLLIQAFAMNDPANAIPVDQVVLMNNERIPSLALAPGVYWVRAIDKDGNSGTAFRISVGKNGSTSKPSMIHTQ